MAMGPRSPRLLTGFRGLDWVKAMISCVEWTCFIVYDAMFQIILYRSF